MGPKAPSPLGLGVRNVWGPALEGVNFMPGLQHPMLLVLTLGPFSFQVQRRLQTFFLTQILWGYLEKFF